MVEIGQPASAHSGIRRHAIPIQQHDPQRSLFRACSISHLNLLFLKSCISNYLPISCDWCTAVHVRRSEHDPHEGPAGVLFKGDPLQPPISKYTRIFFVADMFVDICANTASPWREQRRNRALSSLDTAAKDRTSRSLKQTAARKLKAESESSLKNLDTWTKWCRPCQIDLSTISLISLNVLTKPRILLW